MTACCGRDALPHDGARGETKLELKLGVSTQNALIERLQNVNKEGNRARSTR